MITAFVVVSILVLVVAIRLGRRIARRRAGPVLAIAATLPVLAAGAAAGYWSAAAGLVVALMAIPVATWANAR